MEDVVKRQLTVHYRQSVEEELAVAVQSPDQQTVHRQVCLCNALRMLVDCQLVPPTFWSLFEDVTPVQTKNDVEFVCEVRWSQSSIYCWLLLSILKLHKLFQ